MNTEEWKAIQGAEALLKSMTINEIEHIEIPK